MGYAKIFNNLGYLMYELMIEWNKPRIFRILIKKIGDIETKGTQKL